MKLNLKIEYLKTLIDNFEKELEYYFTGQGFIDALQDFGVEHYKLFMAISRQLSNINILELGTCQGNSSVALAYGNLFGNNIKVDTYDIINFLQDKPKEFFEKYNVNYYLEDLFDKKEIYKDKILSYDLIFIDIDPHEGILEYDFLIWLQKNNYKGLVIFDDIHLGLGHTANGFRPTQTSMQDFWKKIDEKNKIDLTKIGHWSGTGLVSFNFDEHEIILD